ncbi:hypothetical protein DL770_010800 [Monosporascus sp. CRB-9-2]|nr:hypothetical protein DL770_010800 [Monosporascus sp. CRB-9-2]
MVPSPSTRRGPLENPVPPLVKRPYYPNVKDFDRSVSSELELKDGAEARFQKALRYFDRREALRTSRIQMDTWLSKYWRAYTEAEELQIPAVAGFHGHLDFLKAVSAFSPDFAVTQTAIVETTMFSGKDVTELPTVQKLVEHFRSHMRLRKAQGVTAEQMSRGAFGVTLNGETPSQTGSSQNAPDTNSNRNNNRHDHSNRQCLYGVVHIFKECPYICPKVRPSGWIEDPEIRKQVDERIANGTEGLKRAVKHAKKNSKPSTPQSASALFVAGLPSPSTEPQANSVTTGYSLKRSTLLDTCSDFHVGNRKTDFIDLHPPTVDGRLLAGGKYLDILGEGTRRIALTTPDGRTTPFFLKNCLYVPEMHTNLASHRLFQQASIYWDHETDVVYHKESKTSRTHMAKIRWIERQPVIYHIEVTPENDDDDVVPPAAFAVTEEPDATVPDDATVPEDESDPEDEVILESEDEDFVTDPLVEEFLPSKLAQKKLHGNDSRGPLKLLEGDATLWHRRLAHLGPRALEKVVQAVTGAKIQLPSKIDCQDCAVAKARKKASRRPQTRERKPFVTICANLFEFSSAFDGRTKALIITCPVIGARISYTMKRKKHALAALMNAVVFLERQQHIKVKTIVSDGETSFGRRFRRWLLDTGMSHETSPPYTKEPAGVQERAGGVFNEWIAKRDKTPIPEEGLKANVANVVLFGAEAYALTEAVRRGAQRLKKMDPRAYIGYLVGYVASNVYRVWIPSQQHVITVRDATFDETKKYRSDQPQKSSLKIAELNDQIDSIPTPPKATTFLGTSRAMKLGGVETDEDYDSDEESFDSAVSSNLEDTPVHPQRKTGDSKHEDPQQSLPTPEATPDSEDTGHQQPHETLDFLDPSAIIGSRTRSGRRRETPSANTSYRLDFEERNTYPTAFNAVFSAAIRSERLHGKDLPPASKNRQEAMQHKYANEWRAAAQKEWDQIYRVKQSVEVTPLQEAIDNVGSSAILPLMWVFTYKFNKNGILQKFKARIVVRGDLQPREELNAYASTLAGRSFRMLMATAARFDLELRQLDAVNAFLHSYIDELIYGFVISLFGGPIVWRANKQDTVTTSSTEAELSALSQTVKEAIFMQRLFRAIGLELDEELVIQVDNRQTIRLVTEEAVRLITKLKHVDIHSHWLREAFATKKINIEWTPTTAMVADGFTKPLGLQKHQELIRLLNLQDVASRIEEA